MNVSTESNYMLSSYSTSPLRFWFIGDQSVGKSSFIYKFVLESIPRNLPPTIGKMNK